MALTRQQLSDLATWIDQYAAQTEELSAQTTAAVLAAFAGLNPYQAAAVATAAQQAADASDAAQLIAAGLAAQYLAMTAGQILGAPVGVPNLPLPPIRNRVPSPQVFERVAAHYRRQVARGIPHARAWDGAMKYAGLLADTNNRLAQREMSRQVLAYMSRTLGVTTYRRVIRPELSRTGTCGLCITASDQVYNVRDLMPLHDRCKCVVLPIIGDDDPGSSLNNLTVGDIRADAGDSSHGWDLKRVRYVVNEHGELGPVLTVKGQRFTSRADLGGDYDPAPVPDAVRDRNQERIADLMATIAASMQQ